MHSYVIQLCDNPLTARESKIDPDLMDESCYGRYADYFEEAYLNRSEAKKLKEELAALLHGVYSRGVIKLTPESFRRFFAESFIGAKRIFSDGAKLDLDSFDSVYNAVHGNGWKAKRYFKRHDSDLLLCFNDYDGVYTPAEFLYHEVFFNKNKPKKFWVGGIIGYHW